MVIQNGTVFCPDGVFRKMDVSTHGPLVAALDPVLPAPEEAPLNADNCYVVPGFVDIHIHGAMGADFSDGNPQATHTIAAFLLRHGVTSFLGTSLALPEDALQTAYRTAHPLVDKYLPGQAVLLGINMEGPFFSQTQRGAQNEKYIVPPDFELFERLQLASNGNIRTVAVAPETEDALSFIEKASRVCTVSLAHSNAGYALALEAFARGACHVTHLFNGMAPFTHHDTGIVGAAADSGAYVELISDGKHVQPSMVRAVFKLFGTHRVCLISDAMRACGRPEGRYTLGGLPVIVKDGAATIASGSLAGSVTVLSDCVRNAVSFGVPLESALLAATRNPAASVGLQNSVGSIQPGLHADLLVLNKELGLEHILLGGQLQARALFS